ncbi:MAG TPA: hypothetical protein VKT22_13060 [Steroidobacteraceae bacterium]|nr:hypothetical protein [Steroidobacteraceae bacterium]
MFKVCTAAAIALCAALMLAACGNDSNTGTESTSTAHGTLAQNPPFRIASVDAATLAAQLGATSAGAQLLEVTGAPVCGVDFYYLTFWTTGAAGETTESSGALMVPTGAAGKCSGPRPIVEYAHGTQSNKAANIADITDTSNTEGALIAAMFAAQGYIVVAPNYAGYDISTLGYTPYVVASQNAGEMIDILTAARTALPNTLAAATSDSGVLFLTGYSQGGYVAMATLRAMEAAHMKVTAFAGGSGPYALEAYNDAIAFGDVALGATEFAPLILNSYQHAYGNIDSSTTPPFSSTYPNAQTLLPSTTPISTLFAESMLPETALWNSTTPVVDIPGQPVLSAELTAALAIPNPANPANAVFDLGFGNPYLLNNDFRVAYAEDAATNPDGAVPTLMAGAPLAKVKPTFGFRQDLWLNDLRQGNWGPIVPTLLCGGDQDPTVFFAANTQVMQAFWAATPYASAITVLDVSATPSGPFAAIQTGFQASEAALLAYLQTPAGGGLSASAAQAQVIENYHVDVAPFCVLAAKSFFASL